MIMWLFLPVPLWLYRGSPHVNKALLLVLWGPAGDHVISDLFWSLARLVLHS